MASVEQHLCVSLHHLPPQEVQGLQREAEARRDTEHDLLAPGGCLPATLGDAWSYLVNVPPEGDPDARERAARYPVIVHFLQRARREGCSWVLFDTDAPSDPDLPLFD